MRVRKTLHRVGQRFFFLFEGENQSSLKTNPPIRDCGPDVIFDPTETVTMEEELPQSIDRPGGSSPSRKNPAGRGASPTLRNFHYPTVIVDGVRCTQKQMKGALVLLFPAAPPLPFPPFGRPSSLPAPSNVSVHSVSPLGRVPRALLSLHYCLLAVQSACFLQSSNAIR